MKEIWVGTGWKMNHLRADAVDYAQKLKAYCAKEEPGLHLFMCVPYTLLYPLCEVLQGSPIQIGAQNVHWLNSGAATGEISPLMIKDTGATLVEIGHSERRAMFAETNETVNAKVKAVLQSGLRPLVCIGETAQDKAHGVAVEKLSTQIKIAFHEVSPQQAAQLIVAYEPVWAIGDSGSPARPEYADQIQREIKAILSHRFGENIGAQIPVLYGGSVNPQNATALIQQDTVDGLFIGRAAWNVDGFIQIISLIETFRKSSLKPGVI